MHSAYVYGLVLCRHGEMAIISLGVTGSDLSATVDCHSRRSL